MILDRLDCLPLYGPVIPGWEQIGRFLEQSGYAAFAPGRYEIAGTDSYLLVQRYRTVDRDEKKWESHRRHLDIQIVLSGAETIGYRGIDDLVVTEPYSDGKDVAFYQAPRRAAEVLVEAGSFCIFYPQDAHQPGWHHEALDVVKAVVKVRL